ncbi:MAG TPA: SRPBCC family protein [Vicinamibacterales bacterium]|nr:SRPBCC family protein [Vicinamibacterales bacterium]
MPSVRESIDIAAAPDAAFQYVADAPARATMFIPGLNRISNISTERPGAEQSWDYEFNWFGLVITGNSRCTRYEKPSFYQFKTLTGNPSTWSYRFEPKGTGTRVTLEVEYELPQSQLARFAAASALEQMNRNRAREIVANLKALIEP